MRSVRFRFLSVFSVLLVIFGINSFLDFSKKVEGQDRTQLFDLIDSPRYTEKDENSSPASIRERAIKINVEAFLQVNLSELNLPLLDGKTYRAIQNKSEGLEKRGEDNFTWRGKLIEGKFYGDVILTFNRGILNGLIYSPKSVYEITTIKDKVILAELDQNLFPECAGEVNPPAEKINNAPQNIGAVEDSGDRIDVLVVYTEAVKNATGGDEQAKNLAQSAVDAANTAYSNSKIRQRLRLVHAEETALTEANSLSNLRADAATQTLRNTHNADMVAMLTNSLSGCGIGYVMNNVGSGFASSAYSITLRTCAVGNLTFAHELGHNMGSTHNPKNGGSAAYPYSYGHYNDGSYRTVMSYSAQCTSGCPRRPYFSNPAIIFNDLPTGLLQTRNNARSIENTADVVANFRYSGSSIRLDNYSENEFIPRNISKNLSWASENLSGNVKIEISRDESTNWETLIAETPNDGSESINVGGRPTRRARIRISSVNDTGISDSSKRNITIK